MQYSQTLLLLNVHWLFEMLYMLLNNISLKKYPNLLLSQKALQIKGIPQSTPYPLISNEETNTQQQA